MRYLTLSADYGELSLRDEQAGAIDVVNLGAPQDLVDELTAWNARYQPIISMEMNERQITAAELIDELDVLGMELAERLAKAIGDGTKVSYYSEGLLQPLP